MFHVIKSKLFSRKIISCKTFAGFRRSWQFAFPIAHWPETESIARAADVDTSQTWVGIVLHDCHLDHFSVFLAFLLRSGYMYLHSSFYIPAVLLWFRVGLIDWVIDWLVIGRFCVLWMCHSVYFECYSVLLWIVLLTVLRKFSTTYTTQLTFARYSV